MKNKSEVVVNQALIAHMQELERKLAVAQQQNQLLDFAVSEMVNFVMFNHLSDKSDKDLLIDWLDVQDYAPTGTILNKAKAYLIDEILDKSESDGLNDLLKYSQKRHKDFEDGKLETKPLFGA